MNQRVNWNVDGDTDDTGVVANIDTRQAADDPCANTTHDTLRGFDDWHNVSLPFRHFGDSADGPINEPHPKGHGDPTVTEIQQLRAQLNTTDVAVQATARPSPLPLGQTRIEYMVSVTNNGPNPAGDAVASVRLPEQATYVSDTGACIQTSARELRCPAPGEMLSGATRRFEVAVDVPRDLLRASTGPVTLVFEATVDNLAGRIRIRATIARSSGPMSCTCSPGSSRRSTMTR